jgi:hypothetical protein
MMPTVLSTKSGIAWSQNLDSPSGLVFITDTHDGFESLSPSQGLGDYADTKSLLVYESNPYLIHGVRCKIVELRYT